MTKLNKEHDAHLELTNTTHRYEDTHYMGLSGFDEWKAVKMRAIEEANKLQERRRFWRAFGNALLWAASTAVIFAMLTMGAWLPQVLVLTGWSK